MREGIKLIKGDCLEVMKDVPDKSVDLIISDVPYFSTGIKEVGDCQWKKEEDYIDWCLKTIKEAQRTLKDNGSFYWFHNDINIMVDILHRVKKDTNFKLKNQITWDKLETGNQDFLMPLYKNSKIKRRYATSLTEHIYYFTFEDGTGLKKVMCDKNNFTTLRNYSKDLQEFIGLKLKQINQKLNSRKAEHFFYHSSTQWDLCTEDVYNMLIETFDIKKWDRFREYKELRGEYDNLRDIYQGDIEGYESQRYKFNQPYLITPKDIQLSRDTIRPYSTVWHYSRDEDIYKKFHVTPKPIDMLEHIIDVSSKENDIVMDFTMGSGSTGVACINTNRRFIGIELDENYFNIAKKRIEDTYMNKQSNN